MWRTKRSEELNKYLKKVTTLSAYVLVAIFLIASAFYQFQYAITENVDNLSDIYLHEFTEREVFYLSKIFDSQFSALELTETAVKDLSNQDVTVQNISVLQTHLEQIQSNYGFAYFALVDNKGNSISATEEMSPANIDPLELYNGAQRQTVSFKDSFAGKNTILLKLAIDPIPFAGRKFLAVVAGIDKNEFMKKTAMQDNGNKIHTNLVVKDGSIIIYSKSQRNGSQVEGNFFTLLEDSAKATEGYDFKTFKENVANGKEGMFICQQNGINTFLYYSPISGTDSYVITEMSYDVINETVQDFMGIAKIVGLIVAIVVVGLLIVFLYTTYRAQVTQSHVEDISETLKETDLAKQQAEDALMRMAFYDELTGIPNKNMFRNSAKNLLLQPIKYAYVILDIRKFKVVNDLFGYARGDVLLKHIALVLQHDINHNEIAARFSSDVFHLLLCYEDRFSLEKRLRKIADKIGSFSFATNTTFHITLGFGVFVVENIDEAVELMGDRAILALEKIKTLHTTAIFFYNEDIRNSIMEEQEIETEMQNAVDSKQFVVYFQPKFRASTGELAGAEALVRWQHPKRGLIPPDLFIPLFEKNGFITTLDLYVLETVCQNMRHWINEGRPLIPISINQSRLLLYSAGYMDHLLGLASGYNIPHELIELEVTESVFLEDTQKMITIMHQLHEMHFSISMDDFGSGYSTLNMLKEIMVDTLKIDKDFFSVSTDTQRGRTIVSNIISMARDLNINVVAEGVETLEQAEFLCESGCDLLQGFYYSRPLPFSDFEKFMPPS